MRQLPGFLLFIAFISCLSQCTAFFGSASLRLPATKSMLRPSITKTTMVYVGGQEDNVPKKKKKGKRNIFRKEPLISLTEEPDAGSLVFSAKYEKEVQHIEDQAKTSVAMSSAPTNPLSSDSKQAKPDQKFSRNAFLAILSLGALAWLDKSVHAMWAPKEEKVEAKGWHLPFLNRQEQAASAPESNAASSEQSGMHSSFEKHHDNRRTFSLPFSQESPTPTAQVPQSETSTETAQPANEARAVTAGALQLVGATAQGVGAVVSFSVPLIIKAAQFTFTNVAVPSAHFAAEVVLPAAQDAAVRGATQLQPIIQHAVESSAPVVEPALETARAIGIHTVVEPALGVANAAMGTVEPVVDGSVKAAEELVSSAVSTSLDALRPTIDQAHAIQEGASQAVHNVAEAAAPAVPVLRTAGGLVQGAWSLAATTIEIVKEDGWGGLFAKAASSAGESAAEAFRTYGPKAAQFVGKAAGSLLQHAQVMVSDMLTTRVTPDQ